LLLPVSIAQTLHTLRDRGVTTVKQRRTHPTHRKISYKEHYFSEMNTQSNMGMNNKLARNFCTILGGAPNTDMQNEKFVIYDISIQSPKENPKT
jgi:hypothetical protein